MSEPKRYFIQGVTHDGRTFRPSDWAERLAGTMACFRPGGVAASSVRRLGYSPWCVPHSRAGTNGVVVSEAIRDAEPMAWDFVMNFARDNNLVVDESPNLGAP